MLNWITPYLFLLITAIHPLFGQSVSEKKIYNLSIAAIFKNEGPWFKEWIEYHRLVGVDHFYLYNNGSNDNYLEVLEPYIKNGVVTLIDWPDCQPIDHNGGMYQWVFSTQAPAYVHACKVSALKTSKWLAMIDTDEFMVPKKVETMTELLEKYDDYAGVTIRWHLYGTSNVKTLPPNTLLIEVLHKICPLDHEYNSTTKKTIIKTDHFHCFNHPPHYCIYHEGDKEAQLGKDEVQLNHYTNRTEDYYLNCKVKNKERMDNVKLPPEKIDYWLNFGNELEDEEKAIFRYIKELRKRMGFTQS